MTPPCRSTSIFSGCGKCNLGWQSRAQRRGWSQQGWGSRSPSLAPSRGSPAAGRHSPRGKQQRQHPQSAQSPSVPHPWTDSPGQGTGQGFRTQQAAEDKQRGGLPGAPTPGARPTPAWHSVLRTNPRSPSRTAIYLIFFTLVPLRIEGVSG